MPDIYTAAVVGLGQIGMGYDYADTEKSRVLTHASAFDQHPGFRLIAGVSPDPDQRDQFQSRYGKVVFASMSELYRKLRPDVVAVAVPTGLHLQVIRQALTHEPRAIVCEKPLAVNLEDAERIAKLCKHSDSSVLVNYFRRFEPGVLEIKRNLDNKTWGKPVAANAWYSRGLNNNASHLIDLARYLFGPLGHIEVIRTGRSVQENDVEPDFLLQAGEVELFFRAWPSEYYAMIAFELLLEGGRLRYDCGGSKISFSSARSHPLFPGKLSLGDDETVVVNDLARYQWYVADALFDHLANGEPLVSDIDSALEISRTIDQISTARVLNG